VRVVIKALPFLFILFSVNSYALRQRAVVTNNPEVSCIVTQVIAPADVKTLLGSHQTTFHPTYLWMAAGDYFVPMEPELYPHFNRMDEIHTKYGACSVLITNNSKKIYYLPKTNYLKDLNEAKDLDLCFVSKREILKHYPTGGEEVVVSIFDFLAAFATAGIISLLVLGLEELTHIDKKNLNQHIKTLIWKYRNQLEADIESPPSIDEFVDEQTSYFPSWPILLCGGLTLLWGANTIRNLAVFYRQQKAHDSIYRMPRISSEGVNGKKAIPINNEYYMIPPGKSFQDILFFKLPETVKNNLDKKALTLDCSDIPFC